MKGIFEGLYIATPDTCVLTHTSPGAIGMTTRTGDSLTVFQDTILSQQRLTNLGIMKSPGTGSMILSMYRPLRIPVTMPQTKTKAPTPRGRSCQNSPKYSITPIEGSRGRMAPAHCPSTNAFVSLAITSSSLVGMT